MTTDPSTDHAPVCGQSTPSADKLRTGEPLYLPRLERIQSIRNNARRESGGEAEVDVGIGYTDLLDVLDAAEVAHKMREAIKEAAYHLRYIANEADVVWDARDEARLALAKLQPFTTPGA